MSAFLTRLRVEILPPSEVRGRQLYRLLEDFVIDSNIVGRFAVPAGFITDFASIPRVAFAYIDPEDPCILCPSVGHDYGYSLLGVLPDGRAFTRAQWDDVLVELMAISGARIDQRKVVYFAVRVGGASHWKTEFKSA